MFEDAATDEECNPSSESKVIDMAHSLSPRPPSGGVSFCKCKVKVSGSFNTSVGFGQNLSQRALEIVMF